MPTWRVQSLLAAAAALLTVAATLLPVMGVRAQCTSGSLRTIRKPSLGDALARPVATGAGDGVYYTAITPSAIDKLYADDGRMAMVFSRVTPPDGIPVQLVYPFDGDIAYVFYVEHANSVIFSTSTGYVYQLYIGASPAKIAVLGENQPVENLVVESIAVREDYVYVSAGPCIWKTQLFEDFDEEADPVISDEGWELFAGNCSSDGWTFDPALPLAPNNPLPYVTHLHWDGDVGDGPTLLKMVTFDNVLVYSTTYNTTNQLTTNAYDLLTAAAGTGVSIVTATWGSCDLTWVTFVDGPVPLVTMTPTSPAACVLDSVLATATAAATLDILALTLNDANGESVGALTFDETNFYVYEYTGCLAPVSPWTDTPSPVNSSNGGTASGSAATSSDSGASSTTIVVAVVVSCVLLIAIVVVAALFLVHRAASAKDASKQQDEAERGEEMAGGYQDDNGDVAASTLPKQVKVVAAEPAGSSGQATKASAMKKQLAQTNNPLNDTFGTSESDGFATVSGSTKHVAALSRGDFLLLRSDLGKDKSKMLRVREWTDSELVKHNRRCEFVAAGEWTKGKVLGRGANGVVYAAMFPDGSTVAMKEVALFGDEDDVEAQIREQRSEMALLSNMHHDNLVTYYGLIADMDNMVIRLFMENVTGGSLAAMVKHMDGPVPEGTAQRFVRQILRGLAFIHEKGVIHRDMKCDNVLRDATTGAVKLADFGTAKAVGNAAGASRAAQTMIGTPYFMAPEILAAGTVEDAEAGYGAKADIWSLGITTAELLNRGEAPWPPFPTPAHAFLHIANPASRPVLPDHLSGNARDFIEACTRRDPRERPSALELLEHAWMQTILEEDSESPLDLLAQTDTGRGRSTSSRRRDSAPPGTVSSA